MDLTEAQNVLNILESAEFDDKLFPPSIQADKVKAIESTKKLIKELEYQQKKALAGAGMLDSIEECPDCGGLVVTKMAGGYQCTNCDYGEIAF